MDMAALVFQPHLKTRRGSFRREAFLGCDRDHTSVECGILANLVPADAGITEKSWPSPASFGLERSRGAASVRLAAQT
jgi:hypothetical protein